MTRFAGCRCAGPGYVGAVRSDQDDTIDAAGPRRRRRTVTALRIAAATAATAVLVVTGLGWAAHHELTSGILRSGALDVLTGGDRNSRHGDSNILLIGLDSRKDMHGNDLPAEFVTDELHAGDSDAGGYNTNTLILLHVRETAAEPPRPRSPATTTWTSPGTASTRSRRRTGWRRRTPTPTSRSRA